MADELDFDLGLDDQNINRTEERIKNLSSKVRETSQERDEAKKAVETAESARISAEKERDFYASFSDATGKYPGASEYKDAIKEKVLAGYSVEDATMSVLNQEGKLAPQIETAPAPAPAAGGSASINLPTGGEKSIAEMDRNEKRAALEEAVNRGDIYLT